MFQTLQRYRVVPVIAIDDAEAALPLADALLDGGLPLAEITFRTPAAPAVIRTLTEKRPELYVGAGTVLTVQNVKDAIAAGAKFGVAPGSNPDIMNFTEAHLWPLIPGVCTASEIEAALRMNYCTLKFFPAGIMGGVEMLKALSGVYAHMDVRFMPTGGITENNIAEYLSVPTVFACGGTWIATKSDIAAGNWTLIRDRCRRVVDIVATEPDA